MSSIGTGYDLSVTSYSPEGRLFQIEYATKAVKNSGTAIAICCTDGVVFGVENIQVNNLLEDGSNSRIATPDKHIGMISAGWGPDAEAIARKANDEAKSYKSRYGTNIPTKTLTERVASHVHFYTIYSSLRPFGASVLIGGFGDLKLGPELFIVEPSGESWGYHACAIGKGVASARSELEKLKLKEITCKQAVQEITRIIWKVHDFVKDRSFELELSWVCKDTEYLHKKIPKELKEGVIKLAKEAKKKEEEEEGELSDDEKDRDGDTKMKD